FTNEGPHRRNSLGVLSTQTKRLILHGCAKSITISANSRWMTAIEQKHRNIYDAAAILISITQLHWQRRFRRTEPPVMRLRRGALLRLFPVAYMRCPASNSPNTTSWFPKTGIN